MPSTAPRLRCSTVRFDDVEGPLPDPPDCPPLDPDEGRDGRFELRNCSPPCSASSRCQPSTVPDCPHPPRLRAARSPRRPWRRSARMAGIRRRAGPRCARAPSSTKQFPDLWRLDLPLWRALHADEAPVELARRWLQAPGRRLLLDLSALAVAGAPDAQRGAARLSANEMLAAAGGTDAPRRQQRRPVAALADRWPARVAHFARRGPRRLDPALGAA
jgi:hypothetical protein